MFTNHYIPKKISQLTSKDSRISLVGNIIQSKENSFILDDGTAKAEIPFEGKLESKLVRVFCSIADEKLKADVVQPLEGLDLNLFKKVEDLYNKVF
jgi:hypothetical protein